MSVLLLALQVSAWSKDDDVCCFEKKTPETKVCKYSDGEMWMPAWCKLNLWEPPLFLPSSLPHLLRFNGNHGNSALLRQLWVDEQQPGLVSTAEDGILIVFSVYDVKTRLFVGRLSCWMFFSSWLLQAADSCRNLSVHSENIPVTRLIHLIPLDHIHGGLKLCTAASSSLP